MKTKNIFLNIGLALVMGLALMACTQDEDIQSVIKPMKTVNGFHVFPVNFECPAPGYDDESTRAVTYSWQDGATLFARFKNGTTFHHGFLQYEGGQWVLIAMEDFLSMDASGICQLFYFQDSNGDYLYPNLDSQCFDIYNNGKYVESTSTELLCERLNLSEETAVYNAYNAT